MHLINETTFPAMLQCADFGTPDRYAVVIWKTTHDLLPRGVLRPSEEPMPITGDPLTTPFGMFHGDIFLRKIGVDLGVLGTMRLPRAVTQTLVHLRCGAFEHALRVSGDRTWEGSGGEGGLVASSPAPFTEMDLSYQRAFGGVANCEGMQAPFPDNPVGRGYYLSEDEARGKLLPNIEPAMGPHVTKWDDQPSPVGWGPYPMSWGLRARKAVTVDAERVAVADISPSAFNNAHPDLVLSEIAPGTTVEVAGMSETKLRFDVPRLLGNVRVELGAVAFDVKTKVDGVFVWVDGGRVVITQRANFRYLFRPTEVRRAVLTAHVV
jgi:hypothetical protein